MRVVASSDWHGDWTTLGVSRFSEVKKAVRQSVDYAIETKADVYIFLGDLADPDTGGMTFKAIGLLLDTVLRLSKHKIPFIAIAGNHDVFEDGTGATTLTPLLVMTRHLNSIYIVEDPTQIRFADCAFVCLPFTPVSRGVDLEKKTRQLWPPDTDRVIVLSHLHVPGVTLGNETTDMPRGREVLYPFAETVNATARLQGHYHRRQAFDPKDGGPPILIPGSLVRLGFGEEDHEPSFMSLEL